MKPGKELDALVAEKVFHLTGKVGLCLCLRHETCTACTYPLPYSTDISIAWEVVERLRPKYDMDLEMRAGAYIVYFRGIKDYEYASAETAPNAICLAALKIIDLKIE